MSRELMQQALDAIKDIYTAVTEWKERNPTKAKKYSGDSK